jgi:hypothetical protein
MYFYFWLIFRLPGAGRRLNAIEAFCPGGGAFGGESGSQGVLVFFFEIVRTLVRVSVVVTATKDAPAPTFSDGLGEKSKTLGTSSVAAARAVVGTGRRRGGGR